MDLFQAVVQRGIPYDSHESDLYIPVTKETRELILKYPHKENVTVFRNQRDGCAWYDIPFAYVPWWEKREKGGTQ